MLENNLLSSGTVNFIIWLWKIDFSIRMRTTSCISKVFFLPNFVFIVLYVDVKFIEKEHMGFVTQIMALLLSLRDGHE